MQHIGTAAARSISRESWDIGRCRSFLVHSSYIELSTNNPTDYTSAIIKKGRVHTEPARIRTLIVTQHFFDDSQLKTEMFVAVCAAHSASEKTRRYVLPRHIEGLPVFAREAVALFHMHFLISSYRCSRITPCFELFRRVHRPPATRGQVLRHDPQQSYRQMSFVARTRREGSDINRVLQYSFISSQSLPAPYF